jgi:hypothetical protein
MGGLRRRLQLGILRRGPAWLRRSVQATLRSARDPELLTMIWADYLGGERRHRAAEVLFEHYLESTKMPLRDALLADEVALREVLRETLERAEASSTTTAVEAARVSLRVDEDHLASVFVAALILEQSGERSDGPALTSALERCSVDQSDRQSTWIPKRQLCACLARLGGEEALVILSGWNPRHMPITVMRTCMQIRRPAAIAPLARATAHCRGEAEREEGLAALKQLARVYGFMPFRPLLDGDTFERRVAAGVIGIAEAEVEDRIELLAKLFDDHDNRVAETAKQVAVGLSDPRATDLLCERLRTSSQWWWIRHYAGWLDKRGDPRAIPELERALARELAPDRPMTAADLRRELLIPADTPLPLGLDRDQSSAEKLRHKQDVQKYLAQVIERLRS